MLPRYLDNIEIVAPNRSCSEEPPTLKPFPRAMVGMSGAYVSGNVCMLKGPIFDPDCIVSEQSIQQ